MESGIHRHGQGARRALRPGAVHLVATDKLLVNTWLAVHALSLAGILARDLYKHAYRIDYGARGSIYVDAFLQVIRWDNAGALFEGAFHPQCCPLLRTPA